MSTQPKENQEEEEPHLEKVPITSPAVALNLIYAYLDRANQRGAFALQESAKCMACISYLSQWGQSVGMQQQQQQPPPKEKSEKEQPSLVGIRKKN